MIPGVAMEWGNCRQNLWPPLAAAGMFLGRTNSEPGNAMPALRHAVDHLRRFATPRPLRDTDRALLAAFAASRDEAAFAELVRRHGPLVRGVCRRVLGADPAMDDAFQATFLLLAQSR